MPTVDHVRRRLEHAFPSAEIRVVDDTGTGDHFGVAVTCASLAGLSRVEQHQRVYAALDGDVGDHSIHALRITTRVPNDGAP